MGRACLLRLCCEPIRCVMPQPRTCTYCDRPSKTATVRRAGPARVDVYADPERSGKRDVSRCEVVRYCMVEHRPAEKCPRCHGTGRDPCGFGSPDPWVCMTCGGRNALPSERDPADRGAGDDGQAEKGRR